MIGRHNVMNAVAALAAASVWGIGVGDAQRVFPQLQPADKRGEVVRFEEGFTVINDSYNSSPTALDALARVAGAKPPASGDAFWRPEKCCELGGSSPELHRECGRFAAKLRTIDWIIGVQGEAADIRRGRGRSAGIPKERAKFFQNSAEAENLSRIHQAATICCC